MNKKQILGLLLFVTIKVLAAQLQSIALNVVLGSYKKALNQLIIAHDQLYPKQPLQVNNDRLVVQTYQKLITPSIIWITGYARLITSELIRDLDVSADLDHLYHEYMSHEKNVANIVKLFAKSERNNFMQIFYDAIAHSVVQVCYDLVKKYSYEYTFELEKLQSAYQAYQLAWYAQTADMNILGCNDQADFQSNIFENMQSLFSAAMNHYQGKLQKGMVNAQALQSTYKTLQWCAQVLAQVYTDSGDTQSAANQQTLIQNLVKQEQSYQQAIVLKKKADDSMQQARSAIVLNCAQGQANLNSIIASLKLCQQAQNLYDQADQNFKEAVDIIGQSSVSVALELVNNYDVLFRFVQKLWALFLIDQSSQNVYSFPTLTSFVQGKIPAQMNNAIASLNNLNAMISDKFVNQNNMIGLTGATQNILLQTVLDDMQQFAQKICTQHTLIEQDALFNLLVLLQVQDVALVLVEWSNAMVQAASNSDQSMVQDAMGYAKILDNYFSSNQNIATLIPHLPDCLSSDKTWVNFTAQFFVQAGLVTNVAQATALVADAHVQQPQVLTQQDLDTLKDKVNTEWSQAVALSKGSNFAAAATKYQMVMADYQTLYAHASDASAMIEYSQKANIAQSRFTALSLAGTVQFIGTKTFANIKNIPINCLANSYTLTIDTTMLNNSMPQFLSTLTTGQSITKLSILQKQELLALVKAYLIAEYLNDQNLSFVTYYSDYQLTVVQQSKRAGMAEEKISQYLASSANMGILSVTMNSSSSVTVEIQNFPLSLVTPVCSVLSSALQFYQSAVLLLQPSNEMITVGGQSYVSGNDAVIAASLYQKLAYVNLAQSAEYLKQAQVFMQQTLAVIGKNVLPENFSQILNTISGLYLQAQALLYKNLNDNAYTYLTKSGLSTQAQLVQQEFLMMYEQQVAFGQKCLVGDPTKNAYKNLISTINQWYVTWGMQDPSQIAVLNQNIAQLYQNAGESTLNFEYTDPHFPMIKQIHYMIAASYIRSAQEQYEFLKNASQAQAMKNKINDLFFQATIQNINVYLNVQQHAASYTSIQNQTESVTFQQLRADWNNAQSNNANIDPNEMKLFKSVQDLLLDAAIVLQHLQNTKNMDTQSVLDYLEKHTIVTEKISNFAQISLQECTKILQKASALYKEFETNSAALTAVADLLFNAIKGQYLQDYFDISITSTAVELEDATQEFLASMQKEVMNLTNPSIGYVQ